MSNLFRKIITRLSVRKVGNLVISKKIAFENKGKITSGKSSMGVGGNVTVKLISRSKESRFYNAGELVLGDRVKIYSDFGIYIGTGARLSIDDDTYINPSVTIVCKNKVSIGRDCAISWRCQLMDDDLHSVIKDGIRINPVKPIVIGDHVWICSDTIILPGTEIGNGVVVAAGSIVKGKLDAHCLYGGTPAKKLKEGIDWKL